MTALDFLLKAGDETKIVSSGHLSLTQIDTAKANGLFFVDDKTMLGWAILPLSEEVSF